MQQEREIAKAAVRRRAAFAGWRGCLAALAGTAALAGALAAPATVAAAGCANEAFRIGSQHLADCRAYELVSPVDMNGNGLEQVYAISPDGEAVGYGTINVFGEEAPSSVTGKWIARRGGEDWSSKSINAATLGRVPSAYDEPVSLDFSTDLSSALSGSRYPFDPLDQAPFRNFVQSGDSDIYQVWPGGRSEWLSHGPVLPDPEYIDSGFSGASADLSRVFFQSKQQLTGEATGPTAQNLWERHGDQLRIVNLDENGELIPGGAATGRGLAVGASFYAGGEYQQGSNAQGHAYDQSAVSADGRVIFFTAPLEPKTAPRQLYARLDGSRTVLVSRCRVGTCSGEGAPEGAMFLFARPDGSAVTFYSHSPLTEGADPEGGIYRYDVAADTLSFLAPLDLNSGVLAASEDGSYIYLCRGGSELAVYHGGTVQPVASIPCTAANYPEGRTEPVAARPGTSVEGVKSPTLGEPVVTPDAGYLFVTAGGPAEMGNEYRNEGHAEVYYYEAATATLNCLSCRPDDAPARANSYLNETVQRRQQSWAKIYSPLNAGVTPRNLSVDGNRAFFVSEEELVPADHNESQDVYEWERAGSGSCTRSSAAYVGASRGCLSLISAGEGTEGAVFEGASEDGRNVFFATFSSLVPTATGSELELYDARVEGGLAAQQAQPPSSCGDELTCRGQAGVAPAAATTASAQYSGPGNPRRHAAGNCASLQRRLKAIRAQAKRAQGQAIRARRHHQEGKAKQMERRSRQLAAHAGRLARQAKQCANGDRGAAK
ncbi:MAG: hypothetical protein JST31_14720 [Actinobacteria bacterium]|nr:hypothetical protein [Actinomycetota bacterium]